MALRRLAWALAAAAVAGAVAIPVAASCGGALPVLRIVSAQPLVVRGEHFGPGEHVRVTVLGRSRLVHRATAGPHGGFRVAFPAGAVDVCSGFTVSAVGARGSRARVVTMPRGCPPAP